VTLFNLEAWGNHFQICEHVGLKTQKYPYWNKKTKGLDLEGMLQSLSEAPEKSVVRISFHSSCSQILLHACAHNPV
jgi:aspartate aminotransferase, cytoplasmic